jgi:hypothetical protein
MASLYLLKIDFFSFNKINNEVSDTRVKELLIISRELSRKMPVGGGMRDDFLSLCLGIR